MTRFCDFFEDWLYGDDGYYASFKEIGKGGDFYTSVSSSIFFGGSIANEIVNQVKNGKLKEDSYIIEFGAHKGYLLADIIQFIYTLEPHLLQSLRFAIFERFDNLKKIQKDYFQESFGDFVKLEHFDDFSQFKIDSAFVVANEIFDAFPCDVIKDGKILYIDKNLNPVFIQSDELKPNGEYPVGYDTFAKNLFNSIGYVDFVTFDYGDLQKRSDVSLRVYHSHESLPFFTLTNLADKDEKRDINDLFKISDITYDVDFGYLIDIFKDAGFEKKSYKTQASALVDFGIIELLEMVKDKKGMEAYKRELAKIKYLIDPAFLGERFKMVRFVKDREM
jgi:SAM-dependent MidA family methyltransferase